MIKGNSVSWKPGIGRIQYFFVLESSGSSSLLTIYQSFMINKSLSLIWTRTLSIAYCSIDATFSLLIKIELFLASLIVKKSSEVSSNVQAVISEL